MQKVINRFNHGMLANSMAFHDFQFDKIQLNLLFEYIIELFHEYGLNPIRMGVTTPTTQSKTMKTFIRERKKLHTIPEDEIISISMVATSNSPDASEHDMQSTFIISKRNLGFCTIVLDERNFIFDYSKIKEIHQRIIKYISPNYGYCYQREFKKGPEFYPYGVICGIPHNDPEENKIDAWSQKYSNGTYKTGDLRDIYPINLLTDAHLTREVLPNTSFEQFIDSDKRHGTLEKIANNHYSWIVEEVNIPLIREALRPSGMIIAG